MNELGHDMITGAQMRMARGYLKWSIEELAERAGVAISTVRRMESEDGVPAARGPNIEAVEKAFIQAGIVFIPDNGGGPGIRLKS